MSSAEFINLECLALKVAPCEKRGKYFYVRVISLGSLRSFIIFYHFVYLQNARANLPVDTYLKDSTVVDYGGTLSGVQTLNISLGGAFYSYPPADHSTVLYDFFNTISILDGGVFKFFGTANDGDLLKIKMAGSLMIRGGGEMLVNNLELYGM